MTLDVCFIEHSIIVDHFRQYFDKKILPGITANFSSNNSDGRIWALYSTYLTIVLSVTIERMYVNSSN